ncbi:MAG: hypothetical protein ILP17_04325 [Lachnospiraceae bacterium]|nr:hypothetical protein [Lachnospiraceae bacterium]MBP1584899.1 hypothetical protein [Lachnospiraceae bacterium]
MKKCTALFAAAALMLSLTACGGSSDAGTTAPENNSNVEAPADNNAGAEDAGAADVNDNAGTDEQGPEISNEEDLAMSFAEFAAADVDTEVTVTTYVQDKQGWWENEGVGMATFYTQDTDGGYFLYNMPCSKEDYDRIVPGTKLLVTGYKGEWSGEVEILDATYEIIDGETFVANPVDVTDKLGDNDALAGFMNQYVTFTGLTVADRDGASFTYGWDGSKSQGDDLYFNLSDAEGNVYTFVVESYLRGADTEVYQTVETWGIGDVVDITGFMYWYEGPQVHVTIATVK